MWKPGYGGISSHLESTTLSSCERRLTFTSPLLSSDDRTPSQTWLDLAGLHSRVTEKRHMIDSCPPTTATAAPVPAKTKTAKTITEATVHSVNTSTRFQKLEQLSCGSISGRWRWIGAAFKKEKRREERLKHRRKGRSMHRDRKREDG